MNLCMSKCIVLLLIVITPLIANQDEDIYKELEQEIKECWGWKDESHPRNNPNLRIACQMAIRNRIELLKLKQQSMKKTND